jgi:hypothetical protein
MAEKIAAFSKKEWVNATNHGLRIAFHAAGITLLLTGGRGEIGNVASTVFAIAPHLRAPILAGKCVNAKHILDRPKRLSGVVIWVNASAMWFFGAYAIRSALVVTEKSFNCSLNSSSLSSLLPYLRANQLIAQIYEKGKCRGTSEQESVTLDSLELLSVLSCMGWTPIPEKAWVHHGLGLGTALWSLQSSLSRLS